MTEGDIAVRTMTDDDLEQVIAIWTASGVARPWNDPMHDIAFARRGEHSAVLVADRAGRLVATAMVGEDGHRGWVYYVAIDPARQGLGFGRAMMEAAEKWLADRGVRKVQILVRDDNLSACQFYERLGYRNTRSVCLQKIIEPN